MKKIKKWLFVSAILLFSMQEVSAFADGYLTYELTFLLGHFKLFDSTESTVKEVVEESEADTETVTISEEVPEPIEQAVTSKSAEETNSSGETIDSDQAEATESSFSSIEEAADEEGMDIFQ